MLKTKLNKAIWKNEKARKINVINKIQFEIELEEQIKQNRLAFKRK